MALKGGEINSKEPNEFVLLHKNGKQKEGEQVS